jgi:hypothetical protein
MAQRDRIVELVRETHRHCEVFLAAEGELPVGDTRDRVELLTAARRVVWARHVNRTDAWDVLKEAIGTLEDIVGRPAREDQI